MRNSAIITTTLAASAIAAVAAPDFSIPLGDSKSVIDLSAHANLAIGTDKGNGTHGHDPAGEVTLQGIDLGASFRGNEYLEGFINTNVFIDDSDDLDAEWEEGFLKLKNIKALTGSFELRGGRYLNRLGMQNNVHLHGWNFVDANLTTGLFLGEEALKTEGVELSWVKGLSAGNFIVSGSFGNAIEHSHEEEPGATHSEAEETTEKSYFNGELFTVRAQLNLNADDFNYHTIGLNFAHGENGFGRDSQLFSADYLYKWRQNGLESGGKEWTAGLEFTSRNVEWVDEMTPSIQGDTTQQSAMITASHTFKDNWTAAARYGWVEGLVDGSFESNERTRLSLALTHQINYAENISAHARLQYNHDDLDNGDTEDTLWLQLQFSFGKGEVR